MQKNLENNFEYWDESTSFFISIKGAKSLSWALSSIHQNKNMLRTVIWHIFLDMEQEWKNCLKSSHLYEVEVWGLKFSIKIVKKTYLILKSLRSKALPSVNHSSKGLTSLFFSVSSTFSTLWSSLISLTSLVSLGFFKSGKDLIYNILLNLNRIYQILAV